MARINNRKYDLLAREFANMLIVANREIGPTYYAENFGSAIALVQDAHDHVQHQKCRELAREIKDYGPHLFDDHSAFEAPSYYGYGSHDDASIRGLNLKESYKAIGDTDIREMYWGVLGGWEHYSNLDRERFVMTIYSHIEYGSAPKDLQVLLKEKSNGCIDREFGNCDWGDETIMSEAEWNRLDEYMDENNIDVSEQSDLVWKDTSGFDCATMINLINQLDTEIHNRWSGAGDDEDCILGRLEALNTQQPILALTVAQRIERVMFNTKLSWGQRYTACERALTRAEEVA
jgi:hypothetical protein